jgi:hypothetical protein
MIDAHPLVRTAAPRAARVSFWNDRTAVRLKLLLIGACLLGAALLEAPW